MKIIVTGGAGFIGGTITRALCDAGAKVIVVDSARDPRKLENIADVPIYDFIDVDRFYSSLTCSTYPKVKAVIHQGAITDTMQRDGRALMHYNFEYSKALAKMCRAESLPFIYASSAAVYGLSESFVEDPSNESPLNAYGFSKLLFDRWVRRQGKIDSQLVGLRYFNVYGPGEAHKGNMASMIYQMHRSLADDGQAILYAGTGDIADGEHARDFVDVYDVWKVVEWFLEHREVSGIFNVGTGKSTTFNHLAKLVIDWYRKLGDDDVQVIYEHMPDGLAERYQNYSCADLTALRKVGCDVEFRDVDEGVRVYLSLLST
jgi:ADP-L-glycero-D-manno-heptose 6-epimerase